jgi:hypothetical protein
MRDLADLERESQENLVRFLHVDLDVAGTFLDLAQGTSSEHRAQLVEKVHSVIKTTRQFEGRVQDPWQRSEIQEKLERLAKRVADMTGS